MLPLMGTSHSYFSQLFPHFSLHSYLHMQMTDRQSEMSVVEGWRVYVLQVEMMECM